MQPSYGLPAGTPARILASLLATLALSIAAPLAAASPQVAPIPNPKLAVSNHAPYESATCGLCHLGDDPAAPGGLRKTVNAGCAECHADIQEALGGARFAHRAASERCTSCHNPHNSTHAKLLVADVPQLCAGCHAELWRASTQSPVRHQAVTEGRACMSCHTAHVSNVDHLLLALPYELCVDCHSGASPRDDQGQPLTDFAALLAGSRYLHGPVASKDCSACHVTHGGTNFRLLRSEYPSAFYAPFAKENYQLCFACHNEQVVSVAETRTLTGFRDGSQNMHYVHVNKADRGRTCRACHEVHAAPQPHIVRTSVPYGTGSWQLQVNYVPTPTGGTCEKTCHGAKTYDRTKGASSAPAARGGAR